ncbi:MAG: DUF4242 domain-containing protein [Arenibacter sp.]
MPIYMDRHEIPEEITAAHVAQMHREDLKIEHLYGCKGMTYWCDEKRRTAFCLIQAPIKRLFRTCTIMRMEKFPIELLKWRVQ